MSLLPFGWPTLAEVRDGFVRACRAGCDLRSDDDSAAGGLADFIMGMICWACYDFSLAKRRRFGETVERQGSWGRRPEKSAVERQKTAVLQRVVKRE